MKGDNNVKIFSKSAFFEKKLKKDEKTAVRVFSCRCFAYFMTIFYSRLKSISLNSTEFLNSSDNGYFLVKSSFV